MPDLLCAADLIVCKAGGLIVSESLAVGLPLLIAEAIPGQETGNAEVVVQAGAGAMVADGTEALVTLCHWLEGDRAGLTLAATNARKLGRPQAAYAVADLAFQAASAGVQQREHRLRKRVAQLREIIETQASSILKAFPRIPSDL